MDETERLRVLLMHWIRHNDQAWLDDQAEVRRWV